MLAELLPDHKLIAASSMGVYADLRSNETLCNEFTSAMSELGELYHNNIASNTAASFGTDMGMCFRVPHQYSLFPTSAANGNKVMSLTLSLHSTVSLLSQPQRARQITRPTLKELLFQTRHIRVQ